jgi:hypothetical protein
MALVNPCNSWKHNDASSLGTITLQITFELYSGNLYKIVATIICQYLLWRTKSCLIVNITNLKGHFNADITLFLSVSLPDFSFLGQITDSKAKETSKLGPRPEKPIEIYEFEGYHFLFP